MRALCLLQISTLFKENICLADQGSISYPSRDTEKTCFSSMNSIGHCSLCFSFSSQHDLSSPALVRLFLGPHPEHDTQTLGSQVSATGTLHPSPPQLHPAQPALVPLATPAQPSCPRQLPKRPQPRQKL